MDFRSVMLQVVLVLLATRNRLSQKDSLSRDAWKHLLENFEENFPRRSFKMLEELSMEKLWAFFAMSLCYVTCPDVFSLTAFAILDEAPGQRSDCAGPKHVRAAVGAGQARASRASRLRAPFEHAAPGHL
jgi:hypothetical protein